VRPSESAAFTIGERVMAGLGLAVAAPAVLNLAFWHYPLFGLTERQVAILAFIPLFLIMYYVPIRAEARRGK
jgi:hypothetical protein